jgi:hypothetical protein
MQRRQKQRSTQRGQMTIRHERFQSTICSEKAANKTVCVLVDVLLVGFELVRRATNKIDSEKVTDR